MSSVDTVHTLGELPAWPREGTWLAVLGHPIKHSISPAMHNAALEELAKTDHRFASWRYVKFDIPQEHLTDALEKLLTAGFVGLNLTVPHKVLAFERVRAIDEAARPIGAVNTLVASQGTWTGYNTDSYGFAAGLRSDLGIELKGANLLLLGAGGAARGAAVECLRQGVSTLCIANRSAARLEELIRDLRPLVSPETQLVGCSLDATPPDLPGDLVVINATSLGLNPNDPLPLPPALFSKAGAVFDMVYNPPETLLLREARKRGIPCANGLSMLVNQGTKALSLWTGTPLASLEPPMRQAARKAMGLA